MLLRAHGVYSRKINARARTRVSPNPIGPVPFRTSYQGEALSRINTTE